jgi:hypothetical protein
VSNGEVIAFQRDRCSVNAAAETILTMNCIGSKDLECIGEQLKVPILLKVKQDLCALTKESYCLRDHWYKVIGKQFVHAGNTRWWSYYELYCEVLKN